MNMDAENQLTNALAELIKEEIENFEFKDLEVDAENVKGLDDAFTDFMQEFEIEADDIRGLEGEIEKEVESRLRKHSFSADDVDGFDEAVLNALQHCDGIYEWMKKVVEEEIQNELEDHIFTPKDIHGLSNWIEKEVDERIKERGDRLLSYLSPVAWGKWGWKWIKECVPLN
jgi:hypothetical protein